MTALSDAEKVLKARAEAPARGLTPLAALQGDLGLEGEDFLAELARAYAYPALDMARLRDMGPAFEFIPFNLCLERECAA